MTHSIIADMNNDLSYNNITVSIQDSEANDYSSAISVSINMNVNSDSTATITLSRNNYYPLSLTDNLPIVGTVVYINYVLNGLNENTIFEGLLKSVSMTSDTYVLNITDNFNSLVKKGLIKELDFISEVDRYNIFDIKNNTIDAGIYSQYFDTSCKFNNAYYINNGGTYGDPNSFTRFILDETSVRDKFSNAKEIAIDIVASNGYSIDYNSDTVTSGVPNVYDLLYNIKFKRYNTFIKDISIQEDDSLPSGLRSTFLTTTASGDQIEKYNMYDRPAKLSAIKEAIESAGWTIDISSLTATYLTSDIYNVNGEDIIYTISANDDITDFSCKAYRMSEQECTLPIIVRLINMKDLNNGNPVVYKRVDKSYTYTSSMPSYSSTSFSSYIDAFDWFGGGGGGGGGGEEGGGGGTIDLNTNTHMRLVNTAISKMKFEMKGSNDYLFDGRISLNLNIVNSSIYGSSTSLPFDYKLDLNPSIHKIEDIRNISIGDCLSIDNLLYFIALNKSYNFDILNGLSTLAINGNLISQKALQNDGGENYLLPDPIAINATSAPHDAVGMGLLNIGGNDYYNDYSWDFENYVELSHYYNYFSDPVDFQENVEPELTISNYYFHSVYLDPSVDETTLAFPSTASQCRIKYDKVKPVYTQAIVLPPVILDDIIL